MTESRRIRYTVSGVEMVGYLSATSAAGNGGRRPGVLLIHEGGGQDDNVRAWADRMADLGYVAFAMDYMGGGVPHPSEEVRPRLAQLRDDHSAVRALAVAGYDVLAAQSGVDGAQMAAVGFCFGGVMALELARSGVPLKAAVGFHPAFGPARLAESSNISASLLMVSGADDPIASDEDRSRFAAEMRDAGVKDWRLEVLGGVGHAFTNPDIGARNFGPGFAYDERADRRAWLSMVALFEEVFAG